MDNATALSDCALLLALPLTVEAFLQDLENQDEHEYARNHILLGRARDEAWSATGAPIADIAQKVVARARDLGVLAFPEGTLSDVAEAFRRCHVVTIVAHWRAAAFGASDFSAEPRLLFSAIQIGEGPLHRELASRIDPGELKVALSKDTFSARAGASADLLNAAILGNVAPLPGYEPVAKELVYLPMQEMLHRQLMDATFPELLRQGNRVELRDGFHPAASIAACIPQGWGGLVDLALCRSVTAASAIKNGKKERLVAYTEHEVSPEIRIRIVRDIYERLAERPRNYSAELFAVFTSLTKTAGAVRERLEMKGEPKMHVSITLPTSLRALLSSAASVAGTAGSRPTDRVALRMGLEAMLRHYRRMMWVAVGMAVVVLLAEIGAAVASIEHPNILQGLAAAMGITVAGAIETVRRLARDLAQTNMLALLCSELDSDALRPVLSALLRRMKRN